jgi:hypothetical protein
LHKSLKGGTYYSSLKYFGRDTMIAVLLVSLIVLVWVLVVEVPNWLTAGHFFDSDEECHDPVEQAAEISGLSAYLFFERAFLESGCDFSPKAIERAYV